MNACFVFSIIGSNKILSSESVVISFNNTQDTGVIEHNNINIPTIIGMSYRQYTVLGCYSKHKII